MKPDYEAQIKAGAIILAGGDGTRLVFLTRKTVGRDLPKQFCPILGEETLLEQTRRRVSLSISTERPVSVLSRAHEHFYSLTAIQPANPRTAAAILFGLLRLSHLRRINTVAIFSSDRNLSDDIIQWCT